MTQVDAFIHELFEDGSRTIWHRLTPPRGLDPEKLRDRARGFVTLCDGGGFGTDDAARVNCPRCLALGEPVGTTSPAAAAVDD